MSDILINGKKYSGVDTITLNKAGGGTTKYTEGERPTGSIEIKENGTHNVADYEQAVVNVASSGEDRLQWKCDNVKSLYYEFNGYTGTDLNILKGLDTSKVTNFERTFYQCKNVATIPNLDTSSATNLQYMFSLCSKLTNVPINSLGTATSLYFMFNQCTSITEMPNFDYANITNLNQAFYYCKGLTSITFKNTQKVTGLTDTFYSCSALETISNLDIISVTSVSATTLDSCANLKNLDMRNIKAGFNFRFCKALTLNSLINIFKELWDLTGSSSKTQSFSTESKDLIANVYVKLVDVTDEMLAQDQYAANKKPCVVCESTDEGAMTLTEYAISKNWAIA